MAEIKYANDVGNENLGLLDRKDQRLANDIRRRRRDAVDSGDREERIKRFLILRDPSSASAIAKGEIEVVPGRRKGLGQGEEPD